MTKTVTISLAIVSTIFILSAVSAICLTKSSGSNKVEIIGDNDILYTFDLSKTKNQTIKIEYPDGGYNIVEIKDGQICISDADCPDRTCVKTGVLKSSGIPVVCLPHHLIIKYVSDEQIGE